jgi:hypothetical protein
MTSKLVTAGRALARIPRWVVLALVVGAIQTAYVFFVSAGFLRVWPTLNINYDLLAEGFRSGHLYTILVPAPELVAQANPFDPAFSKWWAWDFTYYKGHYYLYWGPFPALVLAAFKALFHIHVAIGDQFALFAFTSLSMLAGALLIDRMARRLFPRVPLAAVVLAIVVFAMGDPFPYLLATPGIYQAAILGGQAFLLWGMVFAFDAVWGAANGEGRRARRLVAAGTCWGFAVACRMTSAPPAALIALTTLLLLPQPPLARWRGLARDALALGAPLALTAAALLVYNKLRFDAWMEFGLGLQLTTMQYRTSTAYLWPNLYSYFLRPLQRICSFPYVATPGFFVRGFPEGFVFPPGYSYAEPVAGMLKVAPWSWLTPVALALGGWLAWTSRKAAGSLAGLDARTRGRLWCVASFAIVGIVTGLPMIGQFVATIRYLADVSPGIALCGVWVAFFLHERFEGRPWARRATWLALLALAGVTIVLGTLLGFQGYMGHFRMNNPALLDRLIAFLPGCS